MSITFQITRLAAGIYSADVLSGQFPVTDPTMHSGIADAILHLAQDIPDGFARFVEVRYGVVSAGTWAIDDLSEQAEAIAGRLASLARAVGDLV